MAALVSGAIFLFVLLFVFLYHNDGYQSHIEYTKGVRNYDLNMRAFCYRTDMNVAEVWDALERNNTYTALKYRFDAQRGVITFYDALTKGRGEISYRLCVAQCGDKTAVKIV